MRLGGVLAMLLVTAAGSSWAQISPGPLSKAHAFLDGPSKCASCHDIAKRPPEFKCLECHRDIRERLGATVGLHPSLVGGDRSGRACAACHSDHNGREYNLIHWDSPPKSFDHHRAGYALEGRHARLACADCHQASRIPAAVAATLSVKDHSRTYLGLPRTCTSCHVDEHRGQLSASCDRCHQFTGWKARLHFDHAQSRFELSGAHERAACEKCHPKVNDPKPYAKYAGLAFQECAPCHADPHRGAFKDKCSACHTMMNWKPAGVRTSFDHASTSYPLVAKHSGLACSACHKQANFKAPVPHAQCIDCHRTDPHRGQMSVLKNGGDCSACHTVAGFKPSTFSADRHGATPYPLADRHAAVPCGKCHTPKGADTVYKVADTRCSACHSDVHKGQFQGPPQLNNCESCHSTRGFRPSSFTLARHRTARFALSGAHEAVVCVDCHKGGGAASPAGVASFRFSDHSCASCHQDPHGGQFAGRPAPTRSGGTVAGCESCHETAAWRLLPGFDHQATGFVLEGAHRATSCGQCHRAGNLDTSMKGVVFRSAPRRCSGCHDDIHAGQFAARMTVADCDLCHRVARWKPTVFKHDTDTTYPLTGAHRGVACALCHKNGREVGGRIVVSYRETPRACGACHGVEIPSGKEGAHVR